MCSVYKVLYINKMHQNNPLNSMTIIIGLHKLHEFNHAVGVIKFILFQYDRKNE